MLKPKLDVVQLASSLWRREVPTRSLRKFPQLLFGQRGKTKSAYLVIDYPILPCLVVWRVEQSRAKLLLRRLHVIPRVFGLDDMGIGIDDGEMILHFCFLLRGARQLGLVDVSAGKSGCQDRD